MRPLIPLLLPSAVVAVDVFDYVIVGGGTCGLLLANRLSEDPSISVAVIDPGSDQRGNEAVEDPSQWVTLGNVTLGVNWGYSSEPQEHVGNRTLDYAAGKGIGGTSLINGMTYIRGDKAQFDAWEALGNPGWNWDTMLEYYKDLEKLFPPTDAQRAHGASVNLEYHGTDGELAVGFSPQLQEGSFYNISRDHWAELDQDVNEDSNSGVTEGFSVWPQTLDPVRNRRSDAATAFFWPAEDRPNLQLINGTGSRVIWKRGGDCKMPEVEAVEYFTHDNKSVTVNVGKEAIFSAGTLRTPLLLELSGVGNPAFLEELGIETVVTLPGVGENMIDQPNNAILYNADGDFNADGYSPYATFVTAKDLFGDEYEAVAEKTFQSLSDYAKTVSEASNGALDADSLQKVFEIQYKVMFEEDTTVGEILTVAQETNLVSAYWMLMPFSRGSVHLKSASDIHNPVIDPRLMQIDLDLDSQVEVGRLAATFWESTDMLGSPIAALPSDASKEEWRAFTIQSMASNSHSLGTAAMMGRELGGVVDEEMRVYGTKGLRVVDASVMPTQFSGHLTATLYAIAQRASEMILSESRG